MSMFTTIVHVHDGAEVEIQIKTGRDNCDRYRLGEEVRWAYSRFRPMEGTLLDGVYDGVSGAWQDERLWWVVIKDHKVHDVLLMPESHKQDQYRAAAMLFQRYALSHPPMEAWSITLWAQHAKHEAEFEQKKLAWAAEEFGKSLEEIAALVTSRYTREKLKEEGLFSKIMPPCDEAAVQALLASKHTAAKD